MYAINLSVTLHHDLTPCYLLNPLVLLFGSCNYIVVVWWYERLKRAFTPINPLSSSTPDFESLPPYIWWHWHVYAAVNEQSYWRQNPLPKMSTTCNCNHCINHVASVKRFAASREKNNELQSHNLARRCVRLLRMKIMAGYVRCGEPETLIRTKCLLKQALARFQ